MFIKGEELLPESGSEKLAIFKLITENNMLNYSIIVQKGCNIGDNFLSLIYSIIVVGEDCERNSKTLNLILKHSFHDKEISKTISPQQLFEREIFVYEIYLPVLYKIQRSHNLGQILRPVAKLYQFSYNKGDEYMIMENLKCSGFQMVNRKVTLDYNHCQMVLKQLASLHALGYILKKENYDLYSQMVEPYRNHHIVYLSKRSLKIKTSYVQMVQKAANVLNPKDEIENAARNKLLKYLEDDIEKELIRLAMKETYDERYSVFIHGDCWSNNLLFKYDEKGNVVDVRLLDWQIARVASPAIDIAFLLYFCCGAQLRDQYDFVQIYYDELSGILKKSGLDANDILPMIILQEHMRQYGRMAIFVLCQLLPVMVRDEDELPDMRQLRANVQSKTSGWGSLAGACHNDDLYAERMRSVLLHAYQNDFY